MGRVQAVKARCCPNEAFRKVPRSIYEGARVIARHIARSEEGETSPLSDLGRQRVFQRNRPRAECLVAGVPDPQANTIDGIRHSGGARFVAPAGKPQTSLKLCSEFG